MTDKSLSCLVISDGRRGIENQALGVAEAIHQLRPMDIITHHLTGSKAFKLMKPNMQFKLKSSPSDYGLSDDFVPQFVIGCGRQAIAPLRALKSAYGDQTYTCYIQDPKCAPSLFDIIICPEHDGLRGHNIMTMIGSPNRITVPLIAGETIKFSDQLNSLKMPRVTALIGGGSKTHSLSKPLHDHHMKLFLAIVDQGHSLLISSSRRTPEFARRDYQHLAQNNNQIWYHDPDSSDPNPYFAFLGASDTILVTEDSTNMLCEACTTGKAVYRLPMQNKSRGKTKFAQLYATLEDRCHVKEFNGDIDTATYIPLQETSRISELLLASYDARDHLLS